MAAKIVFLAEVIVAILLSVSCAITEIKRRKIKKSGYMLVHMPTHFLLAGIFGALSFLVFVYIGAFIANSFVILYKSVDASPIPEIIRGVLASSIRMESTSSTMAKE